MATDSFPADSSRPIAASREFDLFEACRMVVAAIASLRLTVALFACSIFLILIGTLAQVDQDMWEVIDKYFESAFVWVRFQLFVPRTWFPALEGKIHGGFPAPGGFLIGSLMVLNLLAAHLIRFKVQAKGARLAIGLGVTAVGLFVTFLVIASGHNSQGLQGKPPFSWPTFWLFVRGGLVLLALGSSVALMMANKVSLLARCAIFSLAVISGIAALLAISYQPDPSSLRILWQLLLSGLAGLILLVGCWLLFKRRAGVVLLHSGIGLIMFSGFYVSQFADEARMSLREGETVNYLRDIRDVELVVIDAAGDSEDKVVAIPGSRIKPGATVTHESLPFDIHIEEYLKNADLDDVKEGDPNYADSGSGKQFVARKVRASTGTGGGEVDMAAAYVELRKKGSETSLGKYLLSQILAANSRLENIDVDGKAYDVGLRFEREYKSYSISLKDVRKDDYLGTNTPRNYSSDIRLVEGDDLVGEFKIWMNNPLRYAGETFYQSGYNLDSRTGVEITDLQVVENDGWMMPYVGCMLVGIGMAVHFSFSLWRFLSRLLGRQVTTVPNRWWEYAIPALLVLLAAGMVMSKLRAPTDTKANMRIHEFGKLPVMYQGRIKPFDTLARNTLRVVSNKETFEDANGNKLPAIQWLLDVVSGNGEAVEHAVYRIDNLDVLETLGLKRRKGFRYAESEFADRIPKLQEQLEEARKLDPDDRSFYQRKIFEVERRIRAVRLMEFAFTPIPFPKLPTQEEFKADRAAAMQAVERIRQLMSSADRMQAMLDEMAPPLAVPLSNADDKDWTAFATAWNKAYAAQYMPEPKGPDKSVLLWDTMLRSYREAKTKDFNTAVADYQQLLVDAPPERLVSETHSRFLGIPVSKVPFEFFFSSVQPFGISMVLYVVAFVLVTIAWLLASTGYFRVVNRSVFWLLLFVFAVHSFALVSRVIISGRPPVTNLYSSAVFIGWAGVGLGLVLELIYRMGIGNCVAAVSGFATLQIAYALAADGDTFTVLQAVLDTQFWLATHVVTVSLGYIATFVAGFLGIIYLLAMAWRFPNVSKVLGSAIYGVLCFALLLSFTGTVLGGLWADDSWGRFWGWDPKENGALIIVLWNALILHARWGGMIRQKGLAVLAVMGNMTTAWSWFGVNELGVGLHSYGFTEGVLLNLGLFVLSQIAIIGFGLLAMNLWGGQVKTPAV